MKPLHTKDVEDLFRAILSLETVEECYQFFEDACTVKEILDIAQRLRAARMLAAGENYADISHATGMSTGAPCTLRLLKSPIMPCTASTFSGDMAT